MNGTDYDEWQAFLDQRENDRLRWQWPLNIAVILHVAVFGGAIALQNMANSRPKLNNVVMMNLINMPVRFPEKQKNGSGNAVKAVKPSAQKKQAEVKSVVNSLDMQPPAKGKITRQRPRPPKIASTIPKPLAILPPAQGKITRRLSPLPKIASASLKPLATLPLDLQEISRKEVDLEKGDATGSGAAHPAPSKGNDVQLGDFPSRKGAIDSAVTGAKTGIDDADSGLGSEAGQGHHTGGLSGTGAGSSDQEAAPLYASNPPPEYPPQARRRGLQGVVTLEALIDVSGRVADLRPFSSSGHGILDKAALKSVRSWQFTPGIIGGKTKEMWVKVPVRFELN
ncbi:energy transducer TonB [Desulfobulbus sp. F5]|nr:energy transducer TonB [Desulfobulbus sp. F5]